MCENDAQYKELASSLGFHQELEPMEWTSAADTAALKEQKLAAAATSASIFNDILGAVIKEVAEKA